MTIFAFGPGGTARLQQGTAARRSPGATGSAASPFHVHDAGAFEPAPTEISAPAATRLSATIGMPDSDAADRRNRQARRHGQDLLAELSRLQHGLLGQAGGDQMTLARLARMAGAMPVADDPRLGEILDGIVLRAEVEIARWAQP